MRTTKIIVYAFTLTIFLFSPVQSAEMTGEMKQWHKITLNFDGPESSEQASDNLFTNYRMVVTFSNGRQTFIVQGYFAADGDAANSGAIAGNKWRCHFVPSETGKWTWSTSFRNGLNIAVNDLALAGKACSFYGETVFFNVGPSDKTVPDFRAKGTLQYTGGHYLQFAGTKEYFLKGGADRPENFLAYEEIDGTYDADAGSGSYGHTGGFIHQYKPHIRDWRADDLTWRKVRVRASLAPSSGSIFFSCNNPKFFETLPFSGAEKHLYSHGDILVE